jgi:hypothetical protein
MPRNNRPRVTGDLVGLAPGSRRTGLFGGETGAVKGFVGSRVLGAPGEVAAPPPPPPPPPPPSLTVTAGASSGTTGNTIAGPTISAPSGNASNVDWMLGASQNGLTAVPSSGTLAPGASVTPTLSSLSALIYTLTVTNGSGGPVSGSAGVVQFYAPTPPPPPPAPTGTLATLTLIGSGSATVTFCAGQAFRQGDVPSGSGVTISGASAQAQAKVKSTWPDGSVKVAIIAGTAALSAGTATLNVAAGTASTGADLTTADLKAALTQAVSIGCGAFGTASWSGTDWDAPFQTWVIGHRMSSWLFRKAVGSDAHLVAWLEVRLYAGGAVEILPWLENGYLLVTGPTSKSATYTFTMGGSQRFSATIDLPHHCRAPLVSGSALSHWLGADPGVTVLHDVDYLQGTGLLPAYFAKTPSNAAAVTALPATYTPLQLGSFPSGMGSVGGNTYVGLLPEWDVLHLTCGTTATAAAVQRNAYSAGRYPLHYRDEADSHRWARLSQHATLTIKPPEAGWETTPATSGTAPATWSLDHQPSVGYMAYLLTGRRYHLDTVQALASFNALSMSYAQRENASGIFKSQFAGSVRLAAWTWRALAHAVAITPDADTTARGEFVAQLQANIAYYWTRYVGPGGAAAPVGNAFGFIQPAASYSANLNGSVAAGATTTQIPVTQPGLGYSGNAGDGQFVGFSITIGAETRTCTGYVSATNTLTVSPGFSAAPSAGALVIADDGQWWDAPWMQDYFTAVVGWLKDLGTAIDGTATTRLDALWTWKAKSIVGRCSIPSAGFIYRDFAPYELPISPSSVANWDTGAGPWFGSWAAIHAALYAGNAPDNGQPAPYAPNAGGEVDGDLRNNTISDPVGPVGAAVTALAYAAKHRAEGALVAWGLITGAGNWDTLAAAMDGSPVWAVAPNAMPGALRGQPALTWASMPGTAMYGSDGVAAFVPTAVARTTDGVSAAGSPWLDAYCGVAADPVTSTVWQNGNGGHGDYFGSEVLRLDALAATPRWQEWLAGSNGAVVQSNDYATANYPLGIFDTERGWYLTDGSGRKPASGHSYWCHQPVPRLRRVLRFPGWSISPSGTGWKDVDGYKIDSAQGVNGWDAARTFPGSPVGGYTPGGQGGTGIIRPTTCRDPRSDRVYMISQAGGRYWTPPSTEPSGEGTGGTWAAFSSGSAHSQGASAVDTKRGRLLVVNGGSASATYIPVSPSAAPGAPVDITLTGSAAAAIASSPADDGWGMVYVPRLDAYLLKRGTTDGSEIFRIDAATYAVALLTVTGAVPPTASPISSNNANVYGRFFLLPGARAVGYAPKNAANSYLLRVY